ncbi:MAG: hypothetical protein DCF20_17715 [Pseudanabaena sp.]|nr:MAG: hypothetical protein DCF20_17715 [Pseudanabaena sp.]
MPNKLANIDSPSPKLHKDKRNRFRFILHWFNIISVSFLVLWIVIGNFAAFQLEQPVLIAKAELVHKFPKIETNASALKLEELSAKLGINLLVKARNRNDDLYVPTEASQKEFNQIRADLLRYLEDSTSSVPSKPLQQYLSTHSADLAVIRAHIIKSDIPRWETLDINMELGKSSMATESFLGVADLHRLLIADAINNSRLGNSQTAIDSLEFSWRLNQSMKERPSLLSQLVANITDGVQVRGLRKLDLASPVWQKRLISFDQSKLFLTALKFDIFKQYGIRRNFPLRKGGSEQDEQSSSLFNRFLHPFVQPYFTLSAVDTWQVAMRNLDLSFNQDPCISISYEDLPQLSSWNILGFVGSPPSGLQGYKLTKRQIDMELTQKILRLREVASQSGKFPQTLSGIDSSVICKNLRYVYQPSADGEAMTISLSNQNRPEWLDDREGEIPLSYTTKLRKL